LLITAYQNPFQLQAVTTDANFSNTESKRRKIRGQGKTGGKTLFQMDVMEAFGSILAQTQWLLFFVFLTVVY
jgi:hypothetical protein